jgi:hypothetical protein
MENYLQMMHVKYLNIPQPCRQDWNQMTATESGRHCQSCAKTVVDFTRMSNDEIISYLSVSQNVCGRIFPQQTASINMQLASRHPQNKGGWAKWMVAAILFVSTAYSKANAQSAAPATEQTAGGNNHPVDYSLGKVAFPDSAQYQVITGKVTDTAYEALPGVTVRVTGANYATQTDDNGNFSLRVPKSARTIKISFVGFESTVVEIKNPGKKLKIRLKSNSAMLGEMGVTRTSSLRQLYVGLVQHLSLGKLDREI